MAHHSSTPFGDDEATAKKFRDAFRQLPAFGPTGKFPLGKYNQHDEGEIAFGVAADKQAGKVIIDFGKPTAWVGMTADQADAFAESLKSKAAELRG